MTSTQAMCNSFKTEILTGIHALGTTVIRAATTADTFKAALYFSSATLSSSTTAYSSTGELGTTGTGYTSGGATITSWIAPVLSGSTACTTPSAAISYTSISTGSDVQSILIYNNTQSNKAVAVYTFTAQTITAGTLQLTMPSNISTDALLRIA
jgi:hypothetical protein